MLIDAHTHVIPRPYLIELEHRSGVASLQVRDAATRTPAIDTAGVTFSLSPIWFDPAEIIEHMDATGISAQVISPPTFLFHYTDPGDRALELSRIINDTYADFARRFPGRFHGMGTVPLQAVDMAIEELYRLVGMGMRAVEIGTFVNGLSLDAPQLRPFFREAERTGTFVFVHPLTQQQVGEEALEFAYLRNLVGLPVSTAFAIESVIFSGMMDEMPQLKLGFAHGGGVSCMLLERWDRRWRGDAQLRERCARPPSSVFRDLYFDTVAHSAASIELLLSCADPQHIFLGSDAPADMGTVGFPGPVSETGALGSPYGDAIQWKTAQSLFG
ncbi:amidohydrolase family protein [Pseudochelatococcus sp. B33]